jgi:Tripartite tricarboxylate transporter family receptor
MKLPRRQFLHLAAGVAAFPAVSRIAWAQAYPTRPVRIIVGFGAGGSPDITARLLGQWLSERLGQPFVIENRPGAASNIATETVVRASPDGYTLLTIGPPHTINATLYDKLNFNFIRDIAPVASIAGTSYGMLVNQSFPVKTAPEFIAYAKTNPGKIVPIGAFRRFNARRPILKENRRCPNGCPLRKCSTITSSAVSGMWRRRSGSSTSPWSAATCERGSMERYSGRNGSSSYAG